jgi:ABC-type transport system substrate-binding protein
LHDIDAEDMADGRARPQDGTVQLFTLADVKCTWDLLIGRAAKKLRLNPRKSWWNNVTEIAADSPTEATFVLKRPQPAILALIASGYTPVYPCYVLPRDVPQHPIGTGPFKFVELIRQIRSGSATDSIAGTAEARSPS